MKIPGIQTQKRRERMRWIICPSEKIAGTKRFVGNPPWLYIGRKSRNCSERWRNLYGLDSRWRQRKGDWVDVDHTGGGHKRGSVSKGVSQ